MAARRATLVLLALVLGLCGDSPGAEPAEGQQDPQAAAAPEPELGAVAPQIILDTQKQPIYPPAAWAARITGSVVLELTVLRNGQVGEITVARSTTPKMGFEEAAIKAVSEWRFEPGLENGEPVEVRTRIKLNFTRLGVGLEARPAVSGSFVGTAHDVSATQTPSTPAAGERK